MGPSEGPLFKSYYHGWTQESRATHNGFAADIVPQLLLPMGNHLGVPQHSGCHRLLFDTYDRTAEA
jgi:hypothetical protein